MKAKKSSSTLNTFNNNPFYTRKILRGRIMYWIKARWRHFRIGKIPTLFLGPQYKRSRSRIEIDITYACNLRCFNCNRSVRQAPEKLHIPIEVIERFVSDSVSLKKKWDRIRILGGEPTLHPHFRQIVNVLLSYKEFNPDCLIEVVTNGHGVFVQSQLQDLPSNVWVESSDKQGDIQPDFGPFNDAPKDDPRYRDKVFSNGCAIIEDCGMGLTPTGYYPCAIAGGIDRIIGKKLGLIQMPKDSDDMSDVLNICCQLCGRFRDGHYVPRNLRAPLLEEKISPSWKKLYDDWAEGKKNGK